MLRRLLVASIVTSSIALLMFAALGSADSAPSGQRLYGNSSWDPASGHFVGGGGAIEPAFDDSTGTLVYLRTPNNNQNAKNLPGKMVPFGDLGFSLPVNVAPIFLPVYPVGSGIDPATLNCDHLVPTSTGTGDNCIDHGNGVAGAASGFPAYSHGVLGHDHLVGISSTGGDFNVLWEPVLVLFTSVNPNQERITTLDQIETAVNVTHTAFLVPLPPLTFHCSAEGSAAYDNATPAPIG